MIDPLSQLIIHVLFARFVAEAFLASSNGLP